MTKTEIATLEAIRSNGHAFSVWISRSVGRVYFAGEFKISEKVLDKLFAKNAVKTVNIDGQVQPIIQAI